MDEYRQRAFSLQSGRDQRVPRSPRGGRSEGRDGGDRLLRVHLRGDRGSRSERRPGPPSQAEGSDDRDSEERSSNEEMLAELLRINAVPSSYVLPKEIRNLKELTRHCALLVAESTALKNKIHAELAEGLGRRRRLVAVHQEVRGLAAYIEDTGDRRPPGHPGGRAG